MELNYVDTGIELGYSLFVIVLCLIVYVKTKEIYDLSHHKGIKYFRLAFLFFSIAYLFRFVSLLFLIASEGDMHLLFFGYIPFSIASSFAIIFLTYSTIWKKIDWSTAREIGLFCLIVLCISLFVFFTRSPQIFLISQIVLFLIAIPMTYLAPHKKAHFSKLRVVYILLFLFWILNISLLGPSHSFYARYILYSVSAFLFGFIVYKVLNTIK
ncbi:MAG: hypothetical protein WC254_06285 [Candidatus Woesearchaeota archaeon]